MWKRNELEQENREPAPSFPAEPAAAVVTEPATIGASIFIKGDVSGSEDLTVQGRVEGRIDLKTGNVTIGQTGRVKADIFGRTICVEGQVRGNLHGQEVVILRKTGEAAGSIVAPRVNLADGARFQGTIDMGKNGAPAEATGKPMPGKESPGQGAQSPAQGKESPAQAELAAQKQADARKVRKSD